MYVLHLARAGKCLWIVASRYYSASRKHFQGRSIGTMPLPSSPIVVNSGCNCGAIRYKIGIPSLHDWPLHSSSDATPGSGSVHLPFVCSDYCNDCRRATGAVLPHWICTPIAMVVSSFVLRSSAALKADASKRTKDLEPRGSRILIWATVNHHIPDRSQIMINFLTVSMLVQY